MDIIDITLLLIKYILGLGFIALLGWGIWICLKNPSKVNDLFQKVTEPHHHDGHKVQEKTENKPSQEELIRMIVKEEMGRIGNTIIQSFPRPVDINQSDIINEIIYNRRILEHLVTSLEKKPEKIKPEPIRIDSTDLVQRISNDDIYNLINRFDIQLYIQSVIAGKIEEYLGNKANVPTQPVVETPVQSTNIAQPALRTTKIEYQPTNNGFVISEDSSNKIFEMYSSNGEYYYTIVNDSSIKNEILGFITAFANYVETRQDSPIPSTVEVIRDGHLIKNGDIYIVDADCLLQVSLR